MAQSSTIISAADAGFFPLLLGLVRSLHEHQATQLADISVIDLGLLPEQMDELKPLVTTIVPGRWDIEFPLLRQTERWFQAMVARPHLPAYFPGYEIYSWIDADAWLADRRAVQMVIDAATEVGLALVPETHTAYRWSHQEADWPPRKKVHSCYAQGWGVSIAEAAIAMPQLNSGMFAARFGHPIWEKWRAKLTEGLQNSAHRLIEQCALNLTIHGERIAYAALPAWCNWICPEAAPRYNAALKRFEEPMEPYRPISIIHSGDLKHAAMKLSDDGSEVQEVPFNYLALKAAALI